MEIAITRDGVIVTGNYKQLFPDTSFSSNGPSNEWLAEQGAKKVNRFKSHNALTQKLVPCAAYDDGEFVSVVQAQDLTAQEIQAAKDSAMAQLRGTRNQLLTQCDWTQIPDCTIPKKAEWAAYRQTLRDFPATIQDARLTIEWPHSPDWVGLTSPTE
jgi:hypothetical protein